ncbi:Putative magnesium transporter MRS2-G [Coccomyxa sp. Obi]|nr:Putative magnesium transporter MRS2-G [Coccomyxa sp. Obi]
MVPVPYPIDIMVRDKAILLNLEAIRMVILKDQAVILSAPDPADYEGPLTRWVFPTDDNYFVEDIVERLKGVHKYDSKEREKLERRLPFEFKVLEAALEEIVNEMSTEVSELVERGLPALDALVSRVSRRELETVRDVKASMQGILQRAQRLQAELELLLDDDEDMADMYLSRRAAADERRHEFYQAARQSAAEQGLDHPLDEHGRSASDSSLASSNTPKGFSHRVEVKSHVDPRSIEECENLLETYFLQAVFVAVTAGSCTAGVLVIIGILAWAKYRRVLDFIPQEL